MNIDMKINGQFSKNEEPKGYFNSFRNFISYANPLKYKSELFRNSKKN